MVVLSNVGKVERTTNKLKRSNVKPRASIRMVVARRWITLRVQSESDGNPKSRSVISSFAALRNESRSGWVAKQEHSQHTNDAFRNVGPVCSRV
jgi:hypothetical protein